MNLFWQIKPTITHSNRRGGNHTWITQTVERKNSKNECFYTIPSNRWATSFFHNIKNRGYYK